MAEARWCRAAILASSLLLLVLACAAFFKPQLLGSRFSPKRETQSESVVASGTPVIHALALPWLLAGLFGLALARASSGAGRPLTSGARWGAALAGAAALVSLACVLHDWIVDDAAITFAYSENLVRGNGLVLHAGGPRQEAYSNTLWMLLLAGARRLGGEIDVAAKWMCVAFGAASVLTALRVSAEVASSRASYGTLLLAGVVALGTPFVVWSSSGLEHALEALLFTAIVALRTFSKRPLLKTALCLAALMLLRPETPLIVAATIGAYALERWREGRRALLSLWPLLVVPVVAGAALLTFRLWYFGLPFPNPYYAKVSESTFWTSFNLVGPGWSYLFGWMAASAAFALLPILLLGGAGLRAPPQRMAAMLAAAQLGFALVVGGDWMSAHRFVAPALPLLAIVVSGALTDLATRISAPLVEVAALVLAWVMGVATTSSLERFRADPTTPAAKVASIGREFVTLAERLKIDHPTLAHHDAGGTSWAAGIDLIDLGGLGDRTIGQHLNDAGFLRRYLLEELRPTFFFGSKEFGAAATGFGDTQEFADEYVPLQFVDRPLMKSDLCHIRRDAIREAAGVRVVRDGGRVVSVVVSPP